jgi:hypothetical protein
MSGLNCERPKVPSHKANWYSGEYAEDWRLFKALYYNSLKII